MYKYTSITQRQIHLAVEVHGKVYLVTASPNFSIGGNKSVWGGTGDTNIKG